MSLQLPSPPGLRYLLIQLQELHGHVALKLGPGPAGEHPEPRYDHRVEDLEVQGDGGHVGGDEHPGVGNFYDLYLCILARHWDTDQEAH